MPPSAQPTCEVAIVCVPASQHIARPVREIEDLPVRATLQNKASRLGRLARRTLASRVAADAVFELLVPRGIQRGPGAGLTLLARLQFDTMNPAERPSP